MLCCKDAIFRSSNNMDVVDQSLDHGLPMTTSIATEAHAVAHLALDDGMHGLALRMPYLTLTNESTCGTIEPVR